MYFEIKIKIKNNIKILYEIKIINILENKKINKTKT